MKKKSGTGFIGLFILVDKPKRMPGHETIRAMLADKCKSVSYHIRLKLTGKAAVINFLKKHKLVKS
jgi:hypothetical protein